MREAMVTKRRWAWALAFLVLAVCACRPVTVKPVSTADVYRDRTTGALAGDRLSAGAERALDHYAAILGDAREDPDAVFGHPDLPTLLADDLDLVAALVEVALLEARAAQDPERARSYFLEAAAHAWDGMTRRVSEPQRLAIDPVANRLLRLYNRAVARYIGAVRNTAVLAHRTELPRLRGRFALSLSTDQAGSWDPGYFDSLVPADALRLEGVRHRHRRDGIGATVAAVRENRGREPIETYLPPEGIIYPATAVLAFGPPAADVRPVTLSLFDPTERAEIEAGGAHLPLAGDFTAPYALLLSRTQLRLEGVKGAVRPKLLAERDGIYLLEPYDRRKIPILMIHGLLSSPAAFVGISNDVWGDPDLRERYQVWHHFYPSGLPFPWAARNLRQSLDALRTAVDPEADDPAWDDMVVIAHSMGGLLARLLIADSEDILWATMFRIPAAEMRLEAERIDELRELFFFERRTYIRRVIFLATPHRGAERARGPLGKLVNALIKVPLELRDLFEAITRQHPESVSPGMQEILAKGIPSSIHSLRPTSPPMIALREMPPHEDVVVHTIVGDRGKGGGMNASDGYVTYRSAHLENAASEVIVPTGHGVYEHRRTLAEVRRILHEHIGMLGAEHAAGHHGAP